MSVNKRKRKLAPARMTSSLSLSLRGESSRDWPAVLRAGTARAPDRRLSAGNVKMKRNDSSQVKPLLSPDGGTPDSRSQDKAVKENQMGRCPLPSLPSSPRRDDKAKKSPSSHRHGSVGGWSGARAAGNEDDEAPVDVPLSELKKLPACHMELEKLSFSTTHTVLVNVNEFHVGRLLPQSGSLKWDSNFVKMPFCDAQRSRWEDIQKYLSHLSDAPSPAKVEKAIKKYNPSYRDQWTFDALHCFFESIPEDERETVLHTLSKMAKLALKLPALCPKAIPLLRRGTNCSITLSQRQIGCLLANAFYCTFPHRNTTQRHSEYSSFPTINFSSLFGGSSERKNQKFKALFNYFRIITSEESCPFGLVTFQRCCLSKPPDWRRESAMFTKLHISSKGSIEEQGTGMLQVDFACNMVGGGVLSSGLVQEEILFLIHPELIAARLFTERLDDVECLKITGVQQYSTYKGYSDTFRYTGPHTDDTPRDEWKRLQRQIVAIDAVCFTRRREQYCVSSVCRELNKAYCGFQGDFNTPPDYLPAVATGKWGCGAFNGDPKLKALVQLMAAALAQRDVAYFTFKDGQLEKDVQEIHRFLVSRKVTIGRLYHALENYCSHVHRTRELPDLYKFIRDNVTDTTSKH